MQTDRPIQSVAEDKLDRASFAERLAGIIRQRTDPTSLVVGIFGPWGDGKSSTVSMIKEALSTAENVIQVDYNPWFFSSTPDNIARSLFLTLGGVLEQAGIFSREKIGSLLRKYGGLVPKFGSILKSAGELSTTELKELRDKVETIFIRHKTRVVVFVDDIDRLDRIEIQTLFKLVRLSADFPYMTYILTFDDEIVSAALGQAYEGGDARAGRRFLEKIIQLPLHLPNAPSENLRKLVFQAVERLLNDNNIALTEAESYDFANNFALSFEAMLRTPRQARTYENALTFALPALAGETNIVDLLLIEAVRIFVPKLYLAIRENPEQFLKPDRGLRKDWGTNELIKTACAQNALSEAETTLLNERALQRLFPRLSDAMYGNEWDAEWSKRRRICSADYFSRYFSYGIRTGDVADALIEETVSAAVAQDRRALKRHFTAVAKQGGFSIFLRKLRTREGELPAAAVLPLITAIASAAHAFPREPGITFSNWTIMQAAILTSHSAQILPVGDRVAAIEAAIAASTSFVYSVELLRWTHEYEERGERHGFLDQGEIATLAAAIAKKLIDDAGDRSLYRFLGEDTMKVLLPFTWFGNCDGIRESLTKSIRRDGADGAEALIEIACGKSWEMQSGIPHVSEVRKDVYESLAKLVDPDLMFAVLRERYGSKLDSPEFRPARDVQLGERLALQFASARSVAKASSNNPTDDGEGRS